MLLSGFMETETTGDLDWVKRMQDVCFEAKTIFSLFLAIVIIMSTLDILC